MSSIAHVTEGVITNQTVPNTKEVTSGSGSTLGKDAFLQLLVAEMKYQDPMEAENNSTQYISQLATFSELESMQNLQSTAEDLKYQDLLGKTVVMEVDDNMITGQVDNIRYEDGKMKLMVNGEYYNVEDLTQVYDSEYLKAYTKASNVIAAMKEFPADVNTASMAQLATFGEKVADTYYNMSSYEKSFLTDEMVTVLDAYIKKFEEYRGQSMDPQKALLEKLSSESAAVQDLLKKMIDAEGSNASILSSAVTGAGSNAQKALSELQDAIGKLSEEISTIGSEEKGAADAGTGEGAGEDTVPDEILDALLSDTETE